MNRVIVSGLALLTAVSLAACQQAPASEKAAEELKAEKDKTAALEQRIAELEKKAEAPAAPAVVTNLQAPAAAPAMAPLPWSAGPCGARPRGLRRGPPCGRCRVWR